MDARTSVPLCVLFDNGSLRPEATLNLRVIALRWQAVIGVAGGQGERFCSMRPISSA
jgi:hypothetical protein